MQATAIIRSTRAGSFVYNTPLTPSKINMYWHMLIVVAIRPFVNDSVAPLLTQNANISPIMSLGKCSVMRATLNLTYKYRVTKHDDMIEPKPLMMMRSRFQILQEYANQIQHVIIMARRKLKLNFSSCQFFSQFVLWQKMKDGRGEMSVMIVVNSPRRASFWSMVYS